MSNKGTLNQILVGATAGDAITNEALMMRGWLREMGLSSEVYAHHISDSMAEEVRPFATYHPGRGEKQVIFHHSIGDPMVTRVAALPLELLLVYHNITPPSFFAGIDPAWVQRMQLGQQQLVMLRDRTRLALADSAYNEADLRQAGFTQTGILPLPLDPDHYDLPLNEPLAQKLKQGDRPLLLFVGRVAPNKRQEDLLKLLYHLRQIRPKARLALVGDRWTVGYDRWLEQQAAALGLGKSLLLTGKLSQIDMISYYRSASLFVSMSEHEGFGVPLLESMYLGLPVLAFASTAVPATLGDAGILFHHKHYPALAELIDILLTDNPWRERIIAKQRQRVAIFMASVVKEQFQIIIQKILAGELPTAEPK